MKKPLPAALVIEGNVTNSALLRLPGVASGLGPVKSRDARVARRFSNLLGGGYPVSNYSDLAGARTVLIRVPDAAIERVISELCEAEGLDLSGMRFIFADTWLPSRSCSQLQARGAAVATVVPLRIVRQKWFIAEGDAPAVRDARQILRIGSAQLLEVQDKSLACAAQALTGPGLTPMLTAARQALRESGVSGRHVQSLVRDLAESTLLDFVASFNSRDSIDDDTLRMHLAEAARRLPAISPQIELLDGRKRSELRPLRLPH